MKKLLAFLLYLIMLNIFNISLFAQSQLPTCAGASGKLIYIISGTHIYVLDLTKPIVTNVNPYALNGTIPGAALAISPPLGNAVGPTPTFYTIDSLGYYLYSNGANWVNTGHLAASGKMSAVNIGAGGGYIYDLDPITGDIYKYDGTGNGILITTIPDFNQEGIYDVDVDCEGDFYVLKPVDNGWLRKYNPSGSLLQSWTLSGQAATPSGGQGGGGLCVSGNSIYYHNFTGLWSGVINSTNVSFTQIAPLFFMPGLPIDFAKCAQTYVTANIDTAYYCLGGTGVSLNADGVGPFTWSVLSGPATISGSGSAVSVVATATSRILLTGGSNAITSCINTTDTITIIVPTATIDAGAYPDTINGCGVYLDTLNGFLTNTTPGLNYSISWTPGNSINSDDNTLRPIIKPTENTTYFLSVSVLNSQTGCVWTDSVNVVVQDHKVKADFSYNQLLGCSSDTLILINQSTGEKYNYWNFGDSTIGGALNPRHVYYKHNIYNVTLLISNEYCKDSITQSLDFRHPLKAQFLVDRDSICQDQEIKFTNVSIVTIKNSINPAYYWDWGNGYVDTTENVTHNFSVPGTHIVKLIVKDFIPCYDTAISVIHVDSTPYVYFATDKKEICQGDIIKFFPSYRSSVDSLIWDLGDGIISSNWSPIHSYSVYGNVVVNVTAKSKYCPDTSFKDTIYIDSYPLVDVGPDTTICPGQGSLSLVNLATHNSGEINNWNTGERGENILTSTPGVYWLTVTSRYGCSTTDSVDIRNDCYLHIPNAFTPNGDGINDYFFPRQFLSHGAVKFNMRIYNRWGAVLFETNQIDGRGWDGKINGVPQPEGAYLYQIDVVFSNSITEYHKGNVTLIR